MSIITDKYIPTAEDIIAEVGHWHRPASEGEILVPLTQKKTGANTASLAETKKHVQATLFSKLLQELVDEGRLRVDTGSGWSSTVGSWHTQVLKARYYALPEKAASWEAEVRERAEKELEEARRTKAAKLATIALIRAHEEEYDGYFEDSLARMRASEGL